MNVYPLIEPLQNVKCLQNHQQIELTATALTLAVTPVMDTMMLVKKCILALEQALMILLKVNLLIVEIYILLKTN